MQITTISIKSGLTVFIPNILAKKNSISKAATTIPVFANNFILLKSSSINWLICLLYLLFLTYALYLLARKLKTVFTSQFVSSILQLFILCISTENYFFLHLLFIFDSIPYTRYYFHVIRNTVYVLVMDMISKFIFRYAMCYMEVMYLAA